MTTRMTDEVDAAVRRIRIQTAGEGRWYVAYLRWLADQRGSRPVANHEHYGHIPTARMTALKADADLLARNMRASA